MREHRPGVESSHQHRSCPLRQTGRLQAKRWRRIPSSDRHGVHFAHRLHGRRRTCVGPDGDHQGGDLLGEDQGRRQPLGAAIEGVSREGRGERRSPSQGVAAAAGRGRPRKGALLEPAVPSPWPVRSRAAWQMLLCRARCTARIEPSRVNAASWVLTPADSARATLVRSRARLVPGRGPPRTAKDGQGRRSHGCRMPGRGYA
jgi:hypothetical protein